MPKTDWNKLKQITELKYLKQAQTLSKLTKKDQADRIAFDTLREKLLKGASAKSDTSALMIHERNKSLWLQRGIAELAEINRKRALTNAEIAQQKTHVARAFGQNEVAGVLAKKATKTPR
ncbi:hypothetical protein [Algirhabdus cladophorae]|uniref:hypothetical protein n=1 Tax=Algirhabdus cladophorae TaxID=3377108 RepID=UPI003B84A0FF